MENKEKEPVNVETNKKEVKEKKAPKKEENVVLTKMQFGEISKKLAEFEEKALRSQAELINYRKRKDEEVSKMLNFCNEGIIMDLLPSIDNLERALMQEEDGNLKQGVKMIYQALIATLDKYGVKEIEALDKKFDANLHQAVITDSVKDKEEDIILEVLQKGYTLKGKVIRPSMVKVNK